eukprot:CAMPEP_0168399076 /NCGR_PEP_ID=MMETSP0228-20121227/21905_1 /TAXON_ID=133427 /ORGANISM="Protoceratium reticulatum, Strain CCCM 535 (=CCMP 1889)" /LENGTH=38 /DNA_ID= /DNA_START= /DNA_END= /DNA_ORIENTATION=
MIVPAISKKAAGGGPPGARGTAAGATEGPVAQEDRASS